MSLLTHREAVGAQRAAQIAARLGTVTSSRSRRDGFQLSSADQFAIQAEMAQARAQASYFGQLANRESQNARFAIRDANITARRMQSEHERRMGQRRGALGAAGIDASLSGTAFLQDAASASAEQEYHARRKGQIEAWNFEQTARSHRTRAQTILAGAQISVQGKIAQARDDWQRRMRAEAEARAAQQIPATKGAESPRQQEVTLNDGRRVQMTPQMAARYLMARGNAERDAEGNIVVKEDWNNSLKAAASRHNQMRVARERAAQRQAEHAERMRERTEENRKAREEAEQSRQKEAEQREHREAEQRRQQEEQQTAPPERAETEWDREQREIGEEISRMSQRTDAEEARTREVMREAYRQQVMLEQSNLDSEAREEERVAEVDALIEAQKARREEENERRNQRFREFQLQQDREQLEGLPSRIRYETDNYELHVRVAEHYRPIADELEVAIGKIEALLLPRHKGAQADAIGGRTQAFTPWVRVPVEEAAEEIMQIMEKHGLKIGGRRIKDQPWYGMTTVSTKSGGDALRFSWLRHVAWGTNAIPGAETNWILGGNKERRRDFEVNTVNRFKDLAEELRARQESAETQQEYWLKRGLDSKKRMEELSNKLEGNAE